MPKRKKYPRSMTIRLSDELYEKLEMVADKMNKDKSELGREIWEDYLQ